MKEFILWFLAIGIAHYVAQFFSWALADAIPSPGAEATRTIGRIGWSVLSFPTFLVISEPFEILCFINSAIWGLVGSAVLSRSGK